VWLDIKLVQHQLATSWPSEKLPFECKKLTKTWHFFEKIDKNGPIFVNFFEKFQVFVNFLHWNGSFPEGQATIWDVSFGHILGQTCHKWDISEIFSDQISVHFGSPSQDVLNSTTWKVPYLSYFGPIWPTLNTNLSSLAAKPTVMMFSLPLSLRAVLDVFLIRC